MSGALFEREMRREKVLEARARELKLKEREKNKPKVEEEGNFLLVRIQLFGFVILIDLISDFMSDLESNLSETCS